MASGFSSQTRSVAPATTSLAFDFGTFAHAKDRASLSLDGLLKESPTPCSHDLILYNIERLRSLLCQYKRDTFHHITILTQQLSFRAKRRNLAFVLGPYFQEILPATNFGCSQVVPKGNLSSQKYLQFSEGIEKILHSFHRLRSERRITCNVCKGEGTK